MPSDGGSVRQLRDGSDSANGADANGHINRLAEPAHMFVHKVHAEQVVAGTLRGIKQHGNADA